MQKNPLTQKVVLITGSARRIGAEIAKKLHQAGMNVILHYNASEDEAKQLSQQLNQIRDQSASAIKIDLQVLESEKSLVKQAFDVWGRLDALVNNASRFYKTELGKATEYAWDDLIDSNLKAPFFLSQAAIPHLAKTKGCIVNITDICVDKPLRDYPVYCISKGGLEMMTKVLAKELGPDIRVNGVAPGAIIWPEGENSLSDEIKQKIVDHTTLQRSGTPEDIAKAVLFFVRDADYITGQVLKVDGGRTL